MTIREQGIEHLTHIRLGVCVDNLAALKTAASRSAERLMTGLFPERSADKEREFLITLGQQIEDTERQISELRATLDSLNAPPKPHEPYPRLRAHALPHQASSAPSPEPTDNPREEVETEG